MNKIVFTRAGNTFISKINFHGREVSLRCKLTDNQMPNSRNLLNGLARRWNRFPVQSRQLKKFGIPAEAVKVVNVDANLPPESEYFIKGVLNYSFPAAARVRGDLTAFGLSGGSAKALSELGVISVISSALQIKPDVLSGTSGGSIVASILAFNPDPEQVIQTLNRVVQKYSWIDLMDLDLSGIGDLKTCTGFLKGNKIIKTISKEFGLTGKTFSQSEKLLFIPSTDLNSGREMVFSDPARAYDALTEDPREPESSIDQKYVPNIFPEDSRVMDAVEKSIRMPAIFSVLPMDHKSVQYDFSDGGELDNNSSRMLISCVDVGKIVMADLGYSNQLKGLFRNKNFVAVLLQALDIMGSVQREALNGPLCKDDLSIRIINPGLFGVGALESYNRAQDIILSARKTAEHIVSKLSQVPSVSNDPHVLRSRFYSPWNEQTITAIKDPRFKENRMSVKRYGGANVFYLMDKHPIIKFPDVLDILKAETGRADTKQPGFIDKTKFYASLASSLTIGGTIKFVKSLFRKKLDPTISQIQ